MKKTIRKVLAITVMLATLLSTTVAMAAGDYSVVIRNGDDTGISIEGNTYHAYQIFIADDVTSYSVTDDFRGFFTGVKSAGDGSSTTYNFAAELAVINAYEALYGTDTTVGTDGAAPTNADVAEYETALNNYNQLAGHYMNSYENNMYALAIEMRAYLDTVGGHAVDGGIDCKVHATAGEKQEDGYQYATLSGLDTGYYFILDGDSTLNGIGIAASGAFIPLTSSSEYTTYVDVKQSIPTMTKSIFHDDQEKWDIVGDSQIGDKVEFRVISTLPTNIEDYTDEETVGVINSYTYELTDTMSEGLVYNSDVVVYTDEGVTPVPIQYYEVSATETGFVLTFDAINFLVAQPDDMTLYTYYSATLTADAVVASEYDLNTASLVYSFNPVDETDIGTTESTVFHYTFALDVNKVDESGNGLAGARFGIFDEDGYALPLSKGETDYTTGVVSYYYDLNATVSGSDGGYITTETVELQTADGTPTGETATGKFTVYGLNDQTTYTLKEVAAPEGYNTAEQFDFIFTVNYNALGTEITHFTDGSGYVHTAQDEITGDWSSSSTIINRLKIYLPETGGVGTVLFQVGGGALMLGAVAMLLISKRKKEEV